MIIVISIFENVVASKVFTFTFNFSFTMPWRATVGEIRSLSDGVEEIESILPGTGNLWSYSSGGSRWIHIDAVIGILTEISIHFITTLLTPKGEFLITFYPSFKGSARLFFMNERVFQTRSTYQKIFRTYRYSQQKDMFHTDMVGVCQFIRC